jgi:hypothetical protein
MRTTRHLVAAAAVASLAIAVLACGSGNSSSSGGGDGGSSGGGGGDPSGYCSALSDYAKQCNKTDQCTQDEVAACPSIAPQFSAAYLAAATACVKPPYDCSDAGSPSRTQCINQQLGNAMPTGAQTQVKNDFCVECSDGTDKSDPSSCSQFFTLTYNDAGKASSPGLLVLGVNDSLAQKIDQRCTGLSQDGGSVLGCTTSFRVCAALVVAASSNLPKSCN